MEISVGYFIMNAATIIAMSGNKGTGTLEEFLYLMLSLYIFFTVAGFLTVKGVEEGLRGRDFLWALLMPILYPIMFFKWFKNNF